MIVLITYTDYRFPEYKSGDKILWVSHGIDPVTDQVVILPNIPLDMFDKRVYDRGFGEWIIE